MNETHDMPQRLAALLSWYRDMGVTAVLDDAPVNWRARGDIAPGAGFDMPKAAERPTGMPSGRDARERERIPVPAAQPTARPPLPSNTGPVSPARPAPAVRAPANVRSFDGAALTASPAGLGRTKVEARNLTELAAALEAFDGCALKATAKTLCLFRGAETARVMVIGEAPGREEDLAGRPFVGPPGVLLDKMLAAISLQAADVHLTNLVYWRPPGNRKPTAQEAASCAPFLMRQIELVAPEVLVLLGEAAARHMLATGDGIMKVRGKWREVEAGGRKIKAMAMLDPAYVLKAPASKRQVWADLLALKAALGLVQSS